MNRQRKVVITITYNEMGIIIDTKAEEVAQPNLQSTCNELATDCISRQAAIEALDTGLWGVEWDKALATAMLEDLPSAQPEQPEIVRCKDCKYLLPKGSFCSKDMCGLRGMAHYHHVDIHNDFCSWAERREE